MTGNKKRTIIIIAASLLVVLAAFLVVFLMGKTGRAFEKHIEIAREYMENQDYEKAIAEFELALSIDPMGEDAYLGMADAYAALGRYEDALDVLSRGYELTDSDAIKDKMGEIEALMASLAAYESANAGDDYADQAAATVPFTADDFSFDGFKLEQGIVANIMAAENLVLSKSYENSYYSESTLYHAYDPGTGVTTVETTSEDGHAWINVASENGGLYLYCGSVLGHKPNPEAASKYSGPIVVGMSKEQVLSLLGLEGASIEDDAQITANTPGGEYGSMSCGKSKVNPDIDEIYIHQSNWSIRIYIMGDVVFGYELSKF